VGDSKRPSSREPVFQKYLEIFVSVLVGRKKGVSLLILFDGYLKKM
jgi:hypothetical protein